MIITRTPFRISFFGGGTDYPAWYEENSGSVLATTINKYCYISCRYLPPFFEHKHRIVYSKVETVQRNEEIQHPVVRAALEYMNIEEGLEIHHDGDLPSRTGLGSSSSFTVGMLNTLYALRGEMASKCRLASEAIHMERDILKESVGSQDQVLAALGGFKKIDFHPDHTISETPVILAPEKQKELESHIMMFYTGISRIASQVAEKKIQSIPRKGKELRIMHQMVGEAMDLLTNGSCLTEFGKLLHESWKLKRSLADGVTTPLVNEIYDTAMSAGALGGKLLGAGGGGFVMIFARPEDQPCIRERLEKLLCIPVSFETHGSQVIVYQPEGQEAETITKL
ncbi:putative Galactokinase [Nitrospina gracilis 3/211]|uniref:Putative Galactokinase n=1 Tax=Nitrospina gracilis (strain 3/211) TaxID=1266370 RepID=M1YWW8_NITG3|nr:MULTISPECIES: galactokinase [Nitrospina]MCF8722829.1 D-glycero-alpha-D-manno-heptose-7-phosphate kinase [Nitrospina sp. Nb-3]CCQ89787.1 putative Galactokinase [Nitrospina gracilis 3/211]